MKHLRRFQISLFLCLLVLIAMLPLSVLAEDAELLSEAAELTMPEEDVLLGGAEAEEPGYADFVGEVAVSAAGDVEINETNFPDEIFRAYVQEEFDQDGSNSLSEDEIENVFDIDVSYFGIFDLKGIEWFQNLKSLQCAYNQLTDLDVSKNTELDYLWCSSNQLMSLDVSKNVKLKYLYCFNNQLMTLDVSKNTELEGLNCSYNQLTNLDVRQHIKLDNLMCDNNALTDLDVSRNTELQGLTCSNNQLTSLDLHVNTKLLELICKGNSIPSIDITNCVYLRGLVNETLEIYNNGVAVFKVYGKDYEPFQIDSTTALIADGRVIYGTMPTSSPTETPTPKPTAASTPAPTPEVTAKPAGLSKADITVKAQAYTSKALKPTVTVKLDGKTLKKGTDYTVAYKNNKAVGKATVTVTGKGNYTGTAKATFKINPKKVSGLKLKAGKKQIKVTWKKRSGVTAYQVQYATKKDFSNAKKVTVKKAATVKTTLKKLKAKKTYYVRIRAYKTVKGKKYYSAWSSAKMVKTK